MQGSSLCSFLRGRFVWLRQAVTKAYIDDKGSAHILTADGRDQTIRPEKFSRFSSGEEGHRKNRQNESRKLRRKRSAELQRRSLQMVQRANCMTLISRLLIWTVLIVAGGASAIGQGANAPSGPEDSSTPVVGVVAGHPFSAIKYARRVRVMPDGAVRFIRNERYPTRIARDAQGRVMMEFIESDALSPECDQLQMEKPPPCPSWPVFVVDPVARVLAHWVEGEMGSHVAVDMPLTGADIDRMRSTSEMPDVTAQFDPAEGEPKTLDLGIKTLDGILAHGVRTTLESRGTHRVLRIHEVWTAQEMKLIVRVIDGDPNGVEIVRGLSRISMHTDPALFRPPEGYGMQHRDTGDWDTHDLDYLGTWFEK
jgi:hypothetical protein